MRKKSYIAEHIDNEYKKRKKYEENNMNVNLTIDKLLIALSQKGKLYKINSFNFYSEKNNKYCTKYQILKREYASKDDEMIEKYNVVEECFKKIDVLLYLANELKEK